MKIRPTEEPIPMGRMLARAIIAATTQEGTTNGNG